MEKAGTGIKRIKEACDENGNQFEFFFSDAFRIEIFTNSNEQDVPENVPGNVPGNVPENVPGNRAAKILDIDKLKKDNLLQRIGPDRGGHWEIVE